MESPVLSSCGHWFNEIDIIEWIDPDPRVASPYGRGCPICNEVITPRHLSSNADVYKEILSYVQCDLPHVTLLKNFSFTFQCLSHFNKPFYTDTPLSLSCGCLNGFVKQQLDCSSKYGIAYEQFDGTIGAYFNDHSRIVLSKNREYLQYFPGLSASEVGHTPRFLTRTLFPPELAKKVKLINYFAVHFDASANENREGRGRGGVELTDAQTIEKMESSSGRWTLPNVEKCHRENEEYVFAMSNGAVQVCFQDGSSILFYRCNQNFSFITPWRSLHTFNFAAIPPEPHVTARLLEAERLLMKYGILMNSQ